MNRSIVAACLLVIGGVAWAEEPDLKTEAFRQLKLLNAIHAKAELDKMTATLDYEKATNYGRAKASPSDIQALLAATKKSSEDRSKVCRQFYELETGVKKLHDDVVPQWMKDDRAWRSLDKSCSR